MENKHNPYKVLILDEVSLTFLQEILHETIDTIGDHIKSLTSEQ